MRLRAVLIVAASLAACAGRGKPAETPAAAASPRFEPAGPVAPPDAGAAAASSDRDEPTYGELMRGERTGSGPLAEAQARRWLKKVMSLDTTGCPTPREDPAAYYRCWCSRVCGLRFEEGPSTVQISYPYAGTGGPGFEVAPDGYVRACWHAGRGAEVRVTCPAR